MKKERDCKCPYCGGSVIIVHSSVIYKNGVDYGLMKTCSNYPKCDSYCGKDSTLANKELRDLRKMCHRIFDEKWRSGKMKRFQSYQWLQKVMNKKSEDAHIALFSVDDCKKLLSLL